MPRLCSEKKLDFREKCTIVIKNEDLNSEEDLKDENITKSNRNNEDFEPFSMEVTCEGQGQDGNKFLKKKKHELQTLNKIYIKSESSSEDDVPLSNFKIGKSVAISEYDNNLKSDNIKVLDVEFVQNLKMDQKLKMSGLSKQERRERRKLKREKKLSKILRNSELTVLTSKQRKTKKKFYEYKNGKKVFCKSDSESSDFEKYIYFDESKTKRKVKLNPKLSIEDLEEQIKDIKLENACLIKERSRIDEIKLKERLKLRVEIKRLKTEIMDLQLEGYLKNQLIPEIGTTADLVEVLKKHLGEVDYSKTAHESNKDLYRRLEEFAFTEPAFWKDFNSIEFNTTDIHPMPFWKGNLVDINPDCCEYFKPDQNLLKLLSDVIKNSADANSIIETNDFLYKGRLKSGPFDDDCKDDKNLLIVDDYKDSFVNSPSDENYCNSDWNKMVTQSREDGKKDATKSDTEESKKLDIGDKAILIKKEECDVPIKHDCDDFGEYKDDNWQADDFHQDDSCNEHIDEDGSILNDEMKDDPENDSVGLCPECGYDSTWTGFISRHKEAYKDGTKLTPCNVCNMKFLKSGHFDGRHRLKRPPPKRFRKQSFMCEECGACLTSLSGLSQHRLGHAEARFSCPHCPYKCRRRGYLKIHIATHGKKPRDLSKMPPETAINTNTNFQSIDCDSCNHIANSAQALKKHQNLEHIKKSFLCNECPYVALKSSHLTQHLKTHSGDRPFQCSFCDYKSSCKSYLKSHIRYHTGQKPHKCDMCPYQCVTSTRLGIHKKVHSRERNYACSFCEYRTTTNFNLKVHLRQHDKEKKICNICGYSSESLNKLSAHMKTHDGVTVYDGSEIC